MLNKATKMTIEEFQVETSAGESQKTNSDYHDKDQSNSSALLDKFAGYTSLHGFHFILESFSLKRRILWAVLMLLGTSILVVQFLDGYNKLIEHDSVTVKEQQRGKMILFPAVTICNQNMLRKDKIIGTEAQHFLDDIESLMFNESLRNNTNETFYLDLDKIVREAGHNITDMLPGCFWQGKVCGPEDFSLFISAKRGLCYTFNSGKPGHQLRYQNFAGRDKGLVLLLNAEPEQYYGPFSVEGTGFRVLVHDQNDWPDLENYGIDISPGFHSTIRIQRFKTIRLPPPYKSKCGERKLASTENYSYDACFSECYTKVMIDKCQCRFLGMAQLAEYNSVPYCGPEKYVGCLMPASGEFSVDSECDCPIKCDTVGFSNQVSSSSFPSKHILPMLMKRLNISVAVNDSMESFYNKLQTELRELILQLNIFYQTVVTEVTKEKPAYDIHAFGSDIGGNMGLFLGCSLLTLFEFVDLFVLICLRHYRTRQKKVRISR